MTAPDPFAAGASVQFAIASGRCRVMARKLMIDAAALAARLRCFRGLWPRCDAASV